MLSENKQHMLKFYIAKEPTFGFWFKMSGRDWR